MAPADGQQDQPWNVLQLMTGDVITQLGLNTVLGTYGQFSLGTKFTSTEGSLSVSTPSFHGFTFSLCLPFASAKFSKILYTDTTPAADNGGFNLTRVAWSNFRAKFDDILAKYNISAADCKTSGVGDLQADVNYMHELNDTFTVDVAAGINFPTGKKRDENKVFSVPLGYDGHWGVKLSGALQADLHEYFTLGASFNTTLFGHNTKTVRIKTYKEQEGFLFLASSQVKRKKDPIVNIDVHGKMMCPEYHCALSFGYNYTHAGKTTLSTSSTTTASFNATIANTDGRLASWYRHSIQGGVSVLLGCDTEEYQGEVGFIFSLPVAGKNIFTTNGFGGQAGVVFNWTL